LNEDILGSMEFACKVAGAKAVVVLGHTKCGAVKGACDDVKLGNLSILLDKIKPAINAEKTETSNRTASNSIFVEKVATLNVQITMKEIQKKSSILSDMIKQKEIAIIGGMYDVQTGSVDFYKD
jgi:carbonic anhydrase